MPKTRSILFWSAWVIAAIIFVPSLALAWGPAAHLDCSGFLFDSLLLIAPAVRAIMRKHPKAFMYGSVYPDMILGKRYLRPESNNHRWEVGFKVLSDVRSPREESFALGYLSHLAADTVAHNVYIPDLLLDQFDRRGRGHATFELLFDVMVDDEVWPVMRRLSRQNFRDCERLVMRSIPRTPVPKRVNHRLFRSGAVLVRTGGWERIVKRIRPRLSKGIDPADLQPYREDIRKCAVDVLNNQGAADCISRCPTGGSVLAEAEDLRKTLRRLEKRNELDQISLPQVVGAFNRWRDESVFPEPGAFS